MPTHDRMTNDDVYRLARLFAGTNGYGRPCHGNECIRYSVWPMGKSYFLHTRNQEPTPKNLITDQLVRYSSKAGLQYLPILGTIISSLRSFDVSQSVGTFEPYTKLDRFHWDMRVSVRCIGLVCLVTGHTYAYFYYLLLQFTLGTHCYGRITYPERSQHRANGETGYSARGVSNVQ
ncbi:hypothetical protein GGR51DRAFT_79452 [Nemania sp. FL0031]|nr:hypothetical protein GGR51DRAFT_79452 [Nemania sp. FL0031]